jgi:hypothetical protein
MDVDWEVEDEYWEQLYFPGLKHPLKSTERADYYIGKYFIDYMKVALDGPVVFDFRGAYKPGPVQLHLFDDTIYIHYETESEDEDEDQ